MAKATFRLSMFALGSGILLLIPVPDISWFTYIKISHIFLAIILTIMLIKMIYSHVPQELSNPFKSGIKKWNGFKYFLYLFLTIGSGLWILTSLSGSWVKYFHLGIGAWSLIVGWKHTRGKV